jgi:hypothetical protein
MDDLNYFINNSTVRWNRRVWPGKVPRSPVAPPEGRRMDLEKGKTADRKRYRKSRMAKKTGMALIKKKKKN